MSGGDRNNSLAAKSSIPAELTEMTFILEAKRVYEELGSARNLSPLIDSPPKLLLEEELELRLNGRDKKKRNCKIYVFDKYLIVGSMRVKRKKKTGIDGGMSSAFTTAASSDHKVVWFGDKKSSVNSESDGKSENSGSSSGINEGTSQNGTAVVQEEDDSDLDSDEDLDYEEMLLDDEESLANKKRKRYNLKMWIELTKVKPKFQVAGSQFAIMMTYVSKKLITLNAGEYRYDTSVDLCEIWIDDEKLGKRVSGTIQDAIDKCAEEALEKHRLERENLRAMKAAASAKKSSVLTSESIDERSNSGVSIASGDGSEYTEQGSGSVTPQHLSGSSKNARKSNSRSDRVSSGTSSTASTKQSRKRRFVRGKQTLQATAAYLASSKRTFDENGGANHDAVLTMGDIKSRYADYIGVAEADEGLEAEYTVIFKNPTLGFALSSSKTIGPFVCRLVANGLAEASGVALGDRVVSINDHNVPVDMNWKDCVGLIKEENLSGKTLTVTFIRKQKNEIERQRKEEEKKQVLQAVMDGEDLDVASEAATDPDSGKVQAVDIQNHGEIDISTGKKKLTDRQTIEFEKSQSTGNFTIKRKKTKKRRFARKNEILKNMRFHVTSMKEFAEYKKNKDKMFALYENIDALFGTMLSYTEGREKTCVHALKEIYDTEKKYNTQLNNLREFHVALITQYKNVMCRDLKNGRPFCEHRRPARFCKQPSSLREEAVPRKEVDSIFLNLKPIMKSNFYLWKSLQNKLGVLYDKLEKQQKVEVHEMLEVFCKAFAEIAPFLQIYWQYCQRYPQACEKHKSLRADNEHFVKIVSPLERKHNLKLSSMLSKPVQRITKYPLLFTTLKKHVEKYINSESEEKKETLAPNQKGVFTRMMAQLDKASGELVGLAEKVNRKCGEADNLDQMVEVFNEIGGQGGIPHLLAASRRFHSKHLLKFEHVTQTYEEEEVALYLFNDMVAVAVSKSRRSPSLFGGSKLSGVMRAFKNISQGNRASSVGKTKKLSLTSGSTSQDNASKRRSVRATKRSSKGTPKHSMSSVSSKKDEFYEVLVYFQLSKIANIKKRQKESENGEKLFGVDLFYSKKVDTDTEIGEIVLYHATSDDRDAMVERIKDLQMKDKQKRSQLRRVREKIGKKKRTKRFKKKHDQNKKTSEAKRKLLEERRKAHGSASTKSVENSS